MRVSPHVERADPMEDGFELVARGTTGIVGSGSSPSTTCKSVRQTPHARTFDEHFIWPGYRCFDFDRLDMPRPTRVRTIACMSVLAMRSKGWTSSISLREARTHQGGSVLNRNSRK